jgi:hypothetical protein
LLERQTLMLDDGNDEVALDLVRVLTGAHRH